MLRQERSLLVSLKLPVADILASLERQIAFHREQAALHARQEELHRDQRTVHEAELEKRTKHFAALEAAAVPAAELAGPAPAPAPEEDEDLGSNLRLPKLISRILKSRPDGEPFGPTSMTAEVNRRFRNRLDQPADVRSVSAALRRMVQNGGLQLVREGRAYHEALYRTVR
jgi:hypothetical protein